MFAATVDNPRILLLLALLVPLLVLLVLSYRRSRRDLAALQQMARLTCAAAVHAGAVFRFKRSADGVLMATAGDVRDSRSGGRALGRGHGGGHHHRQ